MGTPFFSVPQTTPKQRLPVTETNCLALEPSICASQSAASPLIEDLVGRWNLHANMRWEGTEDQGERFQIDMALDSNRQLVGQITNNNGSTDRIDHVQWSPETQTLEFRMHTRKSIHCLNGSERIDCPIHAAVQR